MSPAAFEPEFIVVGSGAGGGTVAARLAEEGFRVLVLEAGGDPRLLSGANPISGGKNALPDDYDVPGFHPFSTENEALKWDFFVRHYANQDQQKRDPNYVAEYDGQPVDGVWYPRAGTLGGCTAHNAMIFVAPPASDWDYVADLMNDPSWRADQMKRVFREARELPLPPARARHTPVRQPHRPRLERLAHHRALRSRRRDSRHESALRHSQVGDCRGTEVSGVIGTDDEVGLRDPNDWELIRGSVPGLRLTPLTTRKQARMGTRERLLEVQEEHRDLLTIELNALVTKVLFDNQKRAIGVEYLKGERLYSAHANAASDPGATRREARRACLARGDPRGRRLQHAAAADAVRHRRSRRARETRRSTWSSRCRASDATCRIATRWRSSIA